jgi:hypothetical protein
LQPRVQFVRFACCCLFGFVSFLLPSAAHAQSSQFTFTRIADGFTRASPPALNGGHIAFWAKGPGDLTGIYTGPLDGPFVPVVNGTTVIPDAGGTLTSFGSEFGFEPGRVAFYGRNADGLGQYLFDSGTIRQIVASDAPIPDSDKVFDVLPYAPSIEDGHVVFPAQSTTTYGVKPLRGVYLAKDNQLSRIVDSTILVPGDNRAFSDSFASPVINNGRVAFVGNRWDRPGIYLHDLSSGALSKVADTNTLIPGRAETFRSFNALGQGVDLDGDMVAFLGTATPVGGVYVFDSSAGKLITIAESDSPVPGGDSAVFERYFRSVSIDGGRVAFGYGASFGYIWPPPPNAPRESPFYGVYTNLGGTLERLIDKGDVLDGKIVSRAQMGWQGLDGNQIALEVDFTDGTDAMYVATLIPEPATFALVIPAVGLLLVWVRMTRTRKSCK